VVWPAMLHTPKKPKQTEHKQKHNITENTKQKLEISDINTIQHQRQ
jgi:hypothetical protein